jgi:hypothetical protein
MRTASSKYWLAARPGRPGTVAVADDTVVKVDRGFADDTAAAIDQVPHAVGGDVMVRAAAEDSMKEAQTARLHPAGAPATGDAEQRLSIPKRIST